MRQGSCLICRSALSRCGSDPPYQPIHCGAVPLHEVEILFGPDGNIDFRALVRHVRNRQIPALLKGMTLPDAIRTRSAPTKSQVEGFAPLLARWNEAGDVVWHYTVMVGRTALTTRCSAVSAHAR